MAGEIPNSILDSTKKMLGIDADNTDFDVDIIIHINSVFSRLQQLAVGPEDGFEIEDSSKLWSDFLGTNKLINNVKTLMYLQVRMYFDPPSLSFDINAKQSQIDKLEWLINVAVDKGYIAPSVPYDPYPVFFTGLPPVIPPEDEGELPIFYMESSNG